MGKENGQKYTALHRIEQAVKPDKDYIHAKGDIPFGHPT